MLLVSNTVWNKNEKDEEFEKSKGAFRHEFILLPSFNNNNNNKKNGIEIKFVHSRHVIWLINKMRTTGTFYFENQQKQ